ncbi:tetratricopeptide repeat protein [Candidatus Accumulibacter phosphatis]|uniref:Tetratricopeptide repeat protein n=1 Tax=Candidatus Accumulibacter phosphatis TaxID=327160 RepID=A0ABX1TWF2_9PROT|nr:tetratricopeptide repeat protein [Candidatus Accumulibacter sp. ACC012]NMQ28602.1 tetratricopeptide repeat protein [Candidatus Accumulibacter phosphatis]
MSLLMDALRRAEEAKRKASANARPTATVPSELRLDPLQPETPASREATETVEEQPLSSLDAGFDALQTGRASRTSPSAPTKAAAAVANSRANFESQQADERSAARNLFAVKQTPRSRTSLWLFLGLVCVATMAIGGYFWWQLQSISGGTLVAPTAVARPPAYPMPATQPAQPLAAQPTQPAQPPTSTPPGSLEGAAEVRGELPPAGTPAAEARQRSAPTSRLPDPSVTTSAAVKRPSGEPASRPRAAAPGVFQPSSSKQQAQTLDKAYDAWLSDRLDEAHHGYEQVLRRDPRNADALLGLAVIASQRGNAERAQALYLQVLESDPGNVTAQAALINMRGQSSAARSESRLKTLIAKQPDSAALFFALGNLYAGQSRWSEAQQAYFQSYSLEPGNADHVFNVAVSLDQLRQKKLAVQYYRMALTAAETSPSAFDKNAAAQRIVDLQQ